MNPSRPFPVSRRAFLALPFIGLLAYAFSQFRRKSFDVPNVDIDEAKALIAAGALVIDVRDKPQFDIKHIAGAISLPLTTLQVAIPATIAYAKAKTILVYCGDGETSGPEGTHLLTQAGYVHAVNLKPGLEGWAAAALPLERG